MYLKRVEIQGFKSFADPVNIDFKEGITCIIGPNGSGKSNISDAMRWVLGEQSARALRGGKMEEIIFAGTENRRPKGMAEATIVIDNSEGILPIDYAEVAVKRRLFRSGESEYYINSSPCRLRDIRELFMDTGIGVDGYSFIGQGRVTDLISGKPETRREVFEEAAGIIKYKGRKAEAQRRLEGATGNLDRLNDIIADIESRIDGLREESDKAKEHAEISSRYRDLEINITLKNIESMQEKNQELKLQFEQEGTALETMRSRRANFETELASLRGRDSELELKATELRENIAANQNQSLNMKSDAMLNAEKRRAIAKDKERLETEQKQLSERIAEAEGRERALLSAKEGSDARMAALNAELAEKSAEAAAGVAEIDALVRAQEERRNTVFDLSRERSLKEAELASNLELMDSFVQAGDGLAEELKSAEAEQSKAEEDVRRAEASAEQLKQDAVSLSTRKSDEQAAYDKAAQSVAKARHEIEKLSIEIEQQSTRKKTIEEMESNYEGYNAGVRALMSRKDDNIEGVVAALMDVPAGYETAIETALGPALQYVVCADDRTAKDAIGYLKERKAGRATFLPVSTIRPGKRFDATAMEKMAGFDAYALERIRIDRRYNDIFAYLLNGVVIAENLDQAIAMSKKNSEGYRIVTLDGEIINPAGALTGGAYKNKSANLLERRAEITALAQGIDRLLAEKESLGDDLERLAAEIGTRQENLVDIDKEIREKEAELVRKEGELGTLKYRLGELSERIGRRRRGLLDIDKDRENALAMNDALRAEIAWLGEKIIAAEEETAVEAERHAKALTEGETAGESVTAIRLKVAEAGVEKANNDENAERVGAELRMLRAELGTKSDEYGHLVSVEETQNGDADFDETLRAMEAERVEMESALSKAVDDRNAVRREIEEISESYSSLANALETRAAARNAMEVELGRQETRIAAWKEKLFEEFDLSYAHALDFRKPDFVMSAAVKENRLIKERLKELGEVNPGAIRDYDETSERYSFLTEQRDDVLGSMADYNKIVTDMDKISREKFQSCFDAVVTNFDDTFKLLFGGGKGELALEDPDAPLESGILINARPPGKVNLKSIDSYSGGEQTMIAIALMFAILKAKPSPFCILDEIDAALDETNIHRFANYIVNFKETQFGLVTHQRSTMEYADALFGVTMQEQGVTSILSLLLGERETEAFAATLNENNAIGRANGRM